MDFYFIDENYIDFLQDFEKEKRGFTRVPNVRYGDKNKFSFGSVLKVNGYNYYVSVSSFKTPQEANILIRVPGDNIEIKGSLRFNYMVPVPDSCLTRLIIKDISDEKYRDLLNKEYAFCQANEERIMKKANSIYGRVVENKKPILTHNSCDFKILEAAYEAYISR
ncbi:MAG: type III toxin-antitoxin system ToxN/AbiQ family toxin [Eubacteriales bacterium]|nr:type III toxin-antitoxin system ToxN/AbiQ family toxin [Eubacteriales bacterium]